MEELCGRVHHMDPQKAGILACELARELVCSVTLSSADDRRELLSEIEAAKLSMQGFRMRDSVDPHRWEELKHRAYNQRRVPLVQQQSAGLVVELVRIVVCLAHLNPKGWAIHVLGPAVALMGAKTCQETIGRIDCMS